MKVNVHRCILATMIGLLVVSDFVAADFHDLDDCKYWCRKRGELVCCDNEGTCPPVRSRRKACMAPRGSVHHRCGHDMNPREDDAMCLDDKRCFEGEKCCYDRCLDRNVCKAVWERRQFDDGFMIDLRSPVQR